MGQEVSIENAPEPETLEEQKERANEENEMNIKKDLSRRVEEMRDALNLIVSHAKGKQSEQLRKLLQFVVEKSKEEARAMKSLSIRESPAELYAAIKESISSTNLSVLVHAGALILLVLYPHELNMNLGFNVYHQRKLNFLQRKQREMGSESLTEKEAKFLHVAEPFLQFSSHLSTTVSSTFLYLLLDSDPKLATLAAFLLSVLFQNSSRREISQTPKGLFLLCNDNNLVTKYFALTATGNLCLGLNDKLGPKSNSASSIHQYMHAGLVELMETISNPKTEVFILEAALRALFNLCGNPNERIRVAHMKIFYAGLLGKHSAAPGTVWTAGRIAMHANRLGSEEEYEGVGDNVCCPAFHMLLTLLRIPEVSMANEAFKHLSEACCSSDLVFNLGCLIIAELCSVPENIWLLKLPFQGVNFGLMRVREDALEQRRVERDFSVQRELHKSVIGLERHFSIGSIQEYKSASKSSRELSRASKRNSRRKSSNFFRKPSMRDGQRSPRRGSSMRSISFSDESTSPDHFQGGWYHLVFMAFEEHRTDPVIKVALGIACMNLCKESSIVSEYEDMIILHGAVSGLSGLFLGEAGSNFDDAWAKSKFSGELMSATSQMLSPDWLEHVFPGIDVSECFENFYPEYSRPRHDECFNDIWIDYFQQSVCDVLESHVSKSVSREQSDGDSGMPLPYLELFAAIADTTSSYSNLFRILKVVSILSTESESNAINFFRTGFVKTLVQMTWIALENLGFLVHFQSDNDRQMDGQIDVAKGLTEKLPWRLVKTSFANRIGRMVEEVGVEMLLHLLQTLSTFAIYDSLRGPLVREYQATELLQLLFNLFEKVEGETSDKSGFSHGGTTNNAASQALLAIVDNVVVKRIFEETLLGICNLIPVEAKSRGGELVSALLFIKRVVLLMGSRVSDPPACDLFSKARIGVKVVSLTHVKALSAIEHLSRSRGVKLLMLTCTNFLSSVGSLLESGSTSSWLSAREICLVFRTLRNITLAPNGMQLWLKFESRERMSIDSSGVYIPVLGKAVRLQALARLGLRQVATRDEGELEAYRSICLPSQKLNVLSRFNAGTYVDFVEIQRTAHVLTKRLKVKISNACWGVAFNQDEFVVVAEHGAPLESGWSISCWIHIEECTHIAHPCIFKTSVENQSSFVLAQSTGGDCLISALRHDLTDQSEGEQPAARNGRFVYELGCYDASMNQFHGCGIDLKDQIPGWHHLLVVGVGGRTHFFLDGIRGTEIDFQCTTNLYVVGNSVHSNQPWGTTADFRLYPFPMSLDPEDWDLFLDGRIWGLDAFPGPENYGIGSPNEDQLNESITEECENLSDLPWHIRPPEFSRHFIAQFEDGVLLESLFDEFSSEYFSEERLLASHVLGNLCLCPSLRNKILARDCPGKFMHLVSQTNFLRDHEHPFYIGSPTKRSASGKTEDEELLKRHTEQALYRLMFFLS